jgi:3-dehydroquinate synthase
MRTLDLSITSPPSSSRYCCRCGILSDLGNLLEEAELKGPFFIVSNPTVGPVYGRRVKESLEDRGIAFSYSEVPDGEIHKNLLEARRLYERMMDAGLNRQSTVIALGGGVIGDLAGFAAATYMRGIPHIFIPTTLLAQVDASIGGKVAVDHGRAKNIVGSFHHPRLIISDPEVLSTLERRQWASGFAEIIKSAAIASASLFEVLEKHSLTHFEEDYTSLEEIIYEVACIKSSIVGADPFEKNVRAHLNFGHTLGHALESVTAYRRYLHGEAVAIGMRGAAMIAVELGFLQPSVAERIDELLSRYSLSLSLGTIDEEKILEALMLDKKRGLHNVKFVLLKNLEDPMVTDLVPSDLIRSVIRRLKSQ